MEIVFTTTGNARDVCRRFSPDTTSQVPRPLSARIMQRILERPSVSQDMEGIMSVDGTATDNGECDQNGDNDMKYSGLRKAHLLVNFQTVGIR